MEKKGRKVIWRIYLLLFFLSFICYLLCAPLRGSYVTILGLTGLPLSMLVGFILYFIFTILALRKFEGKVNRSGILLSILLGCIILELPIRLMSFQSTLVSLPDSVLKVGAILLAYLGYTIKSRFGKIIVSVFAFSVCIWMAYDGYSKWLHKLNFSTFSGKVEQVLTTPLVFQDSSGNNVPIESFSGKYVMLDFWSSTCGVCIQKFPIVQEFYDDIKSSADFELYSVFCRLAERGEGFETGKNIVDTWGKSFPVLSIDMNEPVLKEIGVDGFPTVIIFDPDGKIIFRGNIENAIKNYKKRTYVN